VPNYGGEGIKIFAISDLHLSGHAPKPMDVFGMHWEGHWDRIRAVWREEVSPEDAMLLPGDLSWAMTLAQAVPDLEEIAELPGKKVLLRGNHDYWWSSVSRVREALPRDMHAVQNDALALGGAVVCGTRGWACPGSAAWEGEADRKIYERELIRMRLSLEAAARIREPGEPLVAMVHFPPFDERSGRSGFTDLLEEYGVNVAVYGHLHGIPEGSAFEGERGGVEYRMVSCDYIGFRPKLILEMA
jgi:predicted phosphohydrolase